MPRGAPGRPYKARAEARSLEQERHTEPLLHAAERIPTGYCARAATPPQKETLKRTTRESPRSCPQPHHYSAESLDMLLDVLLVLPEAEKPSDS